jgi:hypothetical protein
MITALISDFRSDYTDGGSGDSSAREQTKRARIRQHDSAQWCGRVPLPTHWFSACTPSGYQQRATKSDSDACALDAACQPCIIILSKSSRHSRSRSRVLLLGLDRLGCTFPTCEHLIQGSVARALRPNHLSPKCSQRFRRPHLSITTTSRFLGLRRCVEPLSSAARRTRPSSTASATV